MGLKQQPVSYVISIECIESVALVASLDEKYQILTRAQLTQVKLFTVNGTAARITILVSLVLLDTTLVCASTMLNALKAIEISNQTRRIESQTF
jgi:hypothetical protein